MDDFAALFSDGLVAKPTSTLPPQKPAVKPKASDENSRDDASMTLGESSCKEAFENNRQSSKPFNVVSFLPAPVVNTAGKLSDIEIRQKFEKIQQEREQRKSEQEKAERLNLQKEKEEIDRIMRKAGGKSSPLKDYKRGWKFGKGGKKGNLDNVLTDQQKFERSGNYVRQDLKKGKYKERYSGKAGYNRAHFLPNGKRKSFYKNQMQQEEDLVDNGGNYEPLEEDFIGIEKMTQEQKVNHIKENHNVDLTRLAENENSFVTKENIFFKVMNHGFKVLLIDTKYMVDSQLKIFNEMKAELGRCALIENEEDDEKRKEKWLDVLHEFFHYQDFYYFQKELLLKLNNGESCMADFSTGAGKSLLFQFHSVIHEGITVVIVPMISLMIDQVKKIPDKIPAICYNSWVSITDRIKILRRLKENSIKVLFVTPEQFISDIVWYMLIYGVRLNLLCIDEAHCASPYSRSFRPAYALLGDYLKMLSQGNAPEKLMHCFRKNQITSDDKKELQALEEEFSTLDVLQKGDSEKINCEIDEKQNKKEVPVLCLTATSSQEVKYSILKHFRIKPQNYMCANEYIRSNLKVTVSMETQRIKDIVSLLSMPRTKHQKPLLIYCNFKKTIEGLKNYLKQCGLNAQGFSGDYTELQKMNVLQQFLCTDPHHKKKQQENDDLGIDLHIKIDCIISTVSLAMGIDHRSIRGIIHYNMPSSLETYIQEIGRGGRDGKPAFCHTFLTDGDYFFQRGKCLLDNFLDRANLRKIIWFIFGYGGSNKGKSWKYKKGVEMLGDVTKQKYSFIKSASTQTMLKISRQEFANILNVLRDLLRDHYGLDFNYLLDVNSSGVIKLIKPTLEEELMKDPLMKAIKRKSKSRSKSYVFNIIQIANDLDVNPHYLIICLKSMAEKYQCSFYSSDYSIAFTNLRHSSLAMKARTIQVDELVERAYSKNLELIREYAFKVDSFYILLKSQAKKPISQYIDADLADTATELMEKYVQIYFREGATQMIRKMQEDNVCKHLPIIFLQTQKPGQKEFKLPKGIGSVMLDNSISNSDELKDSISSLFSKHGQYVREKMAEDKSYSRVFKDFLCLINGQFSKTFDFAEWNHSEFWGSYEHYDLLDCLDELEGFFAEFFKTTKCKYERVEQELPGEDLFVEDTQETSNVGQPGEFKDNADSDEMISMGEGEEEEDEDEIFQEADPDQKCEEKQTPMEVEEAPAKPKIDKDYWDQDDAPITKKTTKVKTS